MWFNSSLFLVDMFSKRTQTRGSWGRIDKNYIYRMQSINPPNLTKIEKERLLDVFEKVGRVEFPSLAEQYKSGFEARNSIDLAFLDVIGVKKEAQDKLMRKMHAILHERINALKETMGED